MGLSIHHANSAHIYCGSKHDFAVVWDESGIAYYTDNKLTGGFGWDDPQVKSLKTRIPFFGNDFTYSPIVNVAMGGGSFAPRLCTPNGHGGNDDWDVIPDCKMKGKYKKGDVDAYTRLDILSIKEFSMTIERVDMWTWNANAEKLMFGYQNVGCQDNFKA